MVEAARERIASGGLEGKLAVRQMGVDGMDGLLYEAYDAVVSTLVFSELSDDERRFAFKHAARVLKPGGLLVIADEVTPRTLGKRVLHAIVRAPMLVVTYLVSSSSTRPIKDLSGEMGAAGFSVEKEERSHGDAFAVVLGVKKEEG
jgi:cyclopropane fatty-acyl-phospholipid synthase-like methyltransferase